MKIIEYADLDTSKVKRQYGKLIGFLEKDDFYSAEVKKLSEQDLFRAKLDDTNRLLFKIMTYGGERYALVLEVVFNHEYDKSKFLRGVRIDEAKIPIVEPTAVENEKLPTLSYVNPALIRFHVLDKVISFDPDQQGAFQHPTPLIIIGPAGSGKTALTLEKMKQAHGQVLYVTLSRYLADNSRNIYYSHHYENKEQEIAFLSFREYLETMRVPEGREITYRAYAGWLTRIPKQQRVSDAHRLYEEFRGVLTGSVIDKPWLSREEYLALGVRQSIFLADEREVVYSLFGKYLTYLKENDFYDPNILAHSYLPQVKQSYDFVVVDEVQDITNIQLQLILRSLKRPDEFILCGDSNQIVHPNFFSWSGLKSMFYQAEALESGKVTRILQSNFRNSVSVTELANKLLRVKHKRFGSIDRESNYLMNSVSDRTGEIFFVRDTDKAKRELSQKTRRSTKFAVLVMREEDKDLVRQFFDTPLLFSIQEAKGLEYENVVLVNFISSERANFREIIDGVSEEDLNGELDYRRARDKTDKSLEVFKFFINSLYVAVTRAVHKLYLIESDINHPFIGMLGIQNAREDATVDEKQSSIEEWQAEAHKLELQGRQEQADEIRRGILKTQAVPWEVCTPDHVLKLLAYVRNPKEVSQKPKKTLFDYALFYDEPRLMDTLSQTGFDKAKQLFKTEYGYRSLNEPVYEQQRSGVIARYHEDYRGRFYKNILKQCETYGIDHRMIFNKTPLMLAAVAGNAALIRELLAAGADAEAIDHYGCTAWLGALDWALHNREFASKQFTSVHELLAPSYISLKVEDRLVKLDSSQGEFLLFSIFLSLLHKRFNSKYVAMASLNAVTLAESCSLLPDSIVPGYRKKRTYISGLLSKNEEESQNQYGRRLFRRERQGWYVLNPKLAVRHREDWRDIYQHAGIDLIAHMGPEGEEAYRSMIAHVLSDRGEKDF